LFLISKRQWHLDQGSKAAAAGLVLQGTGTAGIGINKISVFVTPDIFPRLLFRDREISLGIEIPDGFFHDGKDM